VSFITVWLYTSHAQYTADWEDVHYDYELCGWLDLRDKRLGEIARMPTAEELKKPEHSPPYSAFDIFGPLST
jgi:hypothetical protein